MEQVTCQILPLIAQSPSPPVSALLPCHLQQHVGGIMCGLNWQETISRHHCRHGPKSLHYVGVDVFGRAQKCVCVFQSSFKGTCSSKQQELWHHCGFKQTNLTCGVGNCSLFPLLKTVLLLSSMIQFTLSCPSPRGFMAQFSCSSPPPNWPIHPCLSCKPSSSPLSQEC